MNYTKMIKIDTNSGIAIVADNNYRLAAYLNGKLYDVNNFRPLDGDGRQLREDSRKTIRAMIPEAQALADSMADDEAFRLDSMVGAEVEKIRRDMTPPPKSFADALQDAFLKTLTEKAGSELLEDVLPVVRQKIVDEFGAVPVVHRFELPERKPVETSEILHKQFDTILNALSAGMAVYFHGPAGTGKSYLGKQLAKVLNLPFHYTNCVTDEVQVKGFVDARGVYHETPFYKAFTQGGVFLLDELDASNEETAVMLNDALANKRFDFPTGAVEAHPDFKCVATGNTFGTGADNIYTGRRQLDAATMDRFILVAVNYDERIENAMAMGDSELVEFAHEYRKAVEAAGIPALFTYRGMSNLAKLASFTDKRTALEMALIKGMAKDDCQIIARSLNKSNAWINAYKEMF